MQDRLPYSPQLHNFLKKEGYTHIQLRGALEHNNHYLLIPWKDDLSSKFEESNFQIEPIGSTDVSDMLDVEFGIEFWVELPIIIAKKFQNSLG